MSFFILDGGMTVNRPRIGVIPLVDGERESYWMLPGYLKGVMEAGGLPAMLPLTADRGMLEQIADQWDAFLFTGGQDVSPAVYGQQALPVCGECCHLRDDMECALLALALERDKPVFGICRGIQLINAALGGTLYQDLPAQAPSGVEHHQSPPYDRPVHQVEIVEDTPLFGLLNKRVLSVNSYHHQAVRDLAPGLRAMAYSTDGLVEAVYAPGKRYVWAVQWHPEFSFQTDSDSKKLFQSFVDAAK